MSVILFVCLHGAFQPTRPTVSRCSVRCRPHNEKKFKLRSREQTALRKISVSDSYRDILSYYMTFQHLLRRAKQKNYKPMSPAVKELD